MIWHVNYVLFASKRELCTVLSFLNPSQKTSLMTEILKIWSFLLLILFCFPTTDLYDHLHISITCMMGFPCGSAGKESACIVGGLGLIPRLGRSPGEGNSYPLQCSGLENSMDCIVHGIAESNTTEWLSLSLLIYKICEYSSKVLQLQNSWVYFCLWQN